LTGTGEIRPSLPEADSPDELGTLSRDFSRLLTQVGEYNAYLKTLGQKLTHELRTPMAVVLTSLENLQADPDGADAERYLERAREGLVRLQAMVSALGAATRVEQALAGADTERFDLAALVGEMSGAYAETHPERRIHLDLPEHPCLILGSPDLIARLLDKLFENALDFCPPDGQISLRLDSPGQTARLRVANTGSRLPDGLADRIFDSLVSARNGDGGSPHLGLGMYIARLIVRHHQGRIAARNLPEDKGVEFTVELPLEGTGSR
jgi:signal transduction histidine kinase